MEQCQQASKPGCPSWSKGADLRPAIFVCVGSNPTPGILDNTIKYCIINLYTFIFTHNIFLYKFFFLKFDKKSV